jgi:hypothetical protein
MDFSRLSRGERVAGVCGALLFIFLWFTWYAWTTTTPVGGVKVSSPGLNAWQSFTWIDIYLFLVAAAAVALLLLRASGSMPAAINSPELLVAAAGAVAFLLILFRLIDTPIHPQTFPGFHVSVSRKLGSFLGLFASAAIAVGGWLAWSEQRGSAYVPPLR